MQTSTLVFNTSHNLYADALSNDSTSTFTEEAIKPPQAAATNLSDKFVKVIDKGAPGTEQITDTDLSPTCTCIILTVFHLHP